MQSISPFVLLLKLSDLKQFPPVKGSKAFSQKQSLLNTCVLIFSLMETYPSRVLNTRFPSQLTVNSSGSLTVSFIFLHTSL